MTKTTILIPARYESSRFPGKPLAMLTGASGASKSLIERTYEATLSVRGADAVYVTTDDARIAEAATAFGGEVVMTSSTCRNGTERCAEAAFALGLEDGLVVNVQGDAPLTPNWYVEALIAFMSSNPEAEVATPVILTETAHLSKLVKERAEGRVGGTTAVFDATGRALYFSKEVLPFSGAVKDRATRHPVYHHVGVYAYRVGALRKYMRFVEGRCEVAEGLEQLRFLENGVAVHCVTVETRGREFWELNNPSDIPIIEEIMRREDMP